MAGPAGGPDDMFEAAWERTLAVNLTAQARLARACLPHLLASGAGRIVNIASTEALVATAGHPRLHGDASTASSASPAAWPSSWGARASPSTASVPARSAPA